MLPPKWTPPLKMRRFRIQNQEEPMFARLNSDIKAVFDRDPAARSKLEVIFCYPGLHAVWFHRLSH